MTPGASQPRVLVTRALEDAAVLSSLLATRGLFPVQVPAILRVWNVDGVAQLARDAPHADDVLVTSVVTAQILAAAAPGAWPHARFCAVGPTTARALDGLGYAVDVTPRTATATALVDALGDLSGRTVVWPRSELSQSGLRDALDRAGATVHEVVAYSNAEPPHFAAQLSRALPVEVTTLLSGSAARRVARAIAPDERWKLGKIAVIGPSTRAVAEASGLTVHCEASPHTAEGLVRAVRDQLAG